MGNQIISQDGYDKLKQELDYLTKTRRREIAARIQSAKDLGDLSENAEYSEAKDAQAFNEGRIIEIDNILKSVTVVNGEQGSVDVVMGSRITVKSPTGEKVFSIVSFNEVDPVNGKISNESPMGKAFLHKRKGDKIKVATPKGEIEYEIIDIK